MNYSDGQEAHIGDKVKLWEGTEGIIVCSIDNKEYSNEYPENDWSYLGKGIIVHSSQVGLVYYSEPDPNMTLIRREKPA